MRRGLLFASFVWLSILSLRAVPAKPVVQNICTTDGRMVEATLMGDEHLNYYITPDGQVYFPDSTGCYRRGELLTDSLPRQQALRIR
ncbi:MAG: hypothetical protein IJ680_00915, partial [Paludibacteraceae bacterium]|nr:hypothetical protein [Paludibacteraceae bacterium]